MLIHSVRKVSLALDPFLRKTERIFTFGRMCTIFSHSRSLTAS